MLNILPDISVFSNSFVDQSFRVRCICSDNNICTKVFTDEIWLVCFIQCTLYLLKWFFTAFENAFLFVTLKPDIKLRSLMKKLNYHLWVTYYIELLWIEFLETLSLEPYGYLYLIIKFTWINLLLIFWFWHCLVINFLLLSFCVDILDLLRVSPNYR